eukprot:1323372-Alexandrium_andersonii.AAC.1
MAERLLVAGAPLWARPRCDVGRAPIAEQRPSARAKPRLPLAAACVGELPAPAPRNDVAPRAA